MGGRYSEATASTSGARPAGCGGGASSFGHLSHKASRPFFSALACAPAELSATAATRTSDTTPARLTWIIIVRFLCVGADRGLGEAAKPLGAPPEPARSSFR